MSAHTLSESATGRRRTEEVRNYLHRAGAELIWRTSTAKTGARRIVEAVHVDGRIVILVETLDGRNELLGWDLYLPASDSPKAQATLEAAIAYLTLGERAR